MDTDLTTTFESKKLSVNKFPAMPEALHELNKVMAASNCNTERIATVLGKDQTLTLKILKLVNSPNYGLANKVSSLKHAVLLLGGNVLRGLIISTTAFDSAGTQLPMLWRHSLACSQASHEIAKIFELYSPEEYAVAGLLHDIGKLVIIKQIPDAWKKIAALMREEPLSSCVAEKKVLGVSHEDVNEMLCKHWNLPENLRVGMVCHHSPHRAKEHQKVAAVVNLADYFAHQHNLVGEHSLVQPDLAPETISMLELDEKKLSHISDIVRRTFENNGLITPSYCDLW